jgi:zinc protease
MMHRFTLALILALAIPAAAHAVTVKTVPAPSGVDVWLSEEHSLPMVAISASFPAGSAYDPSGKEGLSALTAALLDEGAGDMKATAFKQALESRAIHLDISADRDFLVVSVKTLSTNVNEAFRLLGLALAHPRFDAEAVERMRFAILAGLKEDEEDPGTIAVKAWFKTYFGVHPYAHDDNGSAEGLKAITIDDIKAFAGTHLVRGTAKVSVAGDITPEALARQIDATFGSLPPDAPPPTPHPGKVGAPGQHVIAMDVPQPSAVFGVPGPLRIDADFIPTYVANYIYGGGGFSSRLMDEVRDKRGLTYGISTSVADYRAAGIIVGEVASDKTTIASALDVAKSVMARFAKEGATEKELMDAKTYLTGSFPINFDSNVKIAATLNGFQRAGLDADYVAHRNALIDAVTLAQVNASAKKYFDPARLTIVIAGTPVKAPPGAARTVPAKPVSQPEIDKPPTP